MKHSNLILSSSLLAVLSLAACSSDQHPVSAAARPVPPKTAVAQMQRVESVLELPARVQADPAHVVRVFPPAGGRLLRVEVRPGDQIPKGKTVAVLESSDVSQARSDYEKARTESDKANREAARTKLLFDHKVVSERDYLDAESAQKEAQSELDRAISRLRVLGTTPDAASNEVAVRSPLAGTVLDIGASSGELSKSTDNANPLCTVADLSEVWILGDIYEKDMSAARVGMPVQVQISAYPDKLLDGKISAVSDALDPQTRTVKIRVQLPNPSHLLKPEMFATIRIRRDVPSALVIPSSAVLREGGDTAVMVQTAANKFERRLVSVRPLNDQQSEVLSGLKQGDVVVTENASLLRGEVD